MGVAGSGKTTVGEALAGRLRAAYVEADDAHPRENIAKMAAGVPLDDDDRRPWLDRLRDELAAGDRVVVTCSALKRSYRDVLRTAGAVRFVHLDVTPAVLEDRLRSRAGHFMASSMLDSQLATLEPPAADEADVAIVEIDSPDLTAPQVLDRVLAALGPLSR